MNNTFCGVYNFLHKNIINKSHIFVSTDYYGDLYKYWVQQGCYAEYHRRPIRTGGMWYLDYHKDNDDTTASR